MQARRPLDPTARKTSTAGDLAMRTGRWAYRRGFSVLQRAGLHVVPNHFYGPIPDTRSLREELWARPSEAVGVDMNEEGQLRLLEDIRRFSDEYDAFPRHATGDPFAYHWDNNRFGVVDGAVLHGILRSLKPSRMIEVGSGFSTMLATAAFRRNEAEGGRRCHLTVIDPYPHVAVADGMPGVDRLLATPVQDVPFDVFTELGDGDVLFVDTSHVVRTGGDVTYEFLEVLPRLNRGVTVHIHDIYLPAEYPREWVVDRLTFWSEQYLLHAFLAFNSAFEVVWGGQYMRLRHDDLLRQAFAQDDGSPEVGSFWIRRTA